MLKQGFAVQLTELAENIYSPANACLLALSITTPLDGELTLSGFCVPDGERFVPQDWVIPPGSVGALQHPHGGRTGGSPLSYSLADHRDLGKVVVSFHTN